MDKLIGKYLTFLIKNEEYAINITKVIEIIGIQEITHIPRTPEEIKGIINLRGKIIPILDLRLKFGLEEKEYDEKTCIIVIEVDSNTQGEIGLIVDTVNEVSDIENVDMPPQYDEQGYENFLLGIGKLKDRVIMLLDSEDLVKGHDLKALSNQDNTNQDNI